MKFCRVLFLQLYRPAAGFMCLLAGIPGMLLAGEGEVGSFAFASETRRPDMTREASDTAPKYNPTAHVRTTTKEEAGNYRKRDLLTTRYSPTAIREAVAGAGPFRPFPPAGDPAYEALPQAERATIIGAAESFLGYDWPTITAGTYLDFYETGSSAAFHAAWFSRLKALETLLYAEILEGQGRFVRDISNGIWAFCEQTTWAQPAHLNVEVPGVGLPSPDQTIVALRASEVAAMMATAEYFLAGELDALNPVFRERIHYEVNRHLLKPFLERTDYWWMAYEKPFTNNWNPWITSNYLLSALVFSGTEAELSRHIEKAIDVLDRFLNVYPEDGGCEEGPAYWNHAGGRLLDCLDLLGAATGGLIDLYDEPLIGEMGNFMWYSHIHGPWYVNFADALARYTPKPLILYRYGKAVGSKNLKAFAGKFEVTPFLTQQRLVYIFMRQLRGLFLREEFKRYDRPFEPRRFVVLDDLETVYIRQGPDTGKGFYLAAKGGYNAESHNHNDVGNFIVFLDGEPLLIDAGVGTYTSKTFSEQRYEIWSMQSSYHNLPEINGQAQPHMIQWRSRHFKATDSSREALVEIGLETAYPEAANLESYDRMLRFDRTREQIDLTEALVFRDGNHGGGGNRLAFHLMTDHAPAPGADAGSLILSDPESGMARARVTFPDDLDILVTRIELEDPRMASNWGDTLYRITFKSALAPESVGRIYDFSVSRP